MSEPVNVLLGFDLDAEIATHDERQPGPVIDGKGIGSVNLVDGVLEVKLENHPITGADTIVRVKASSDLVALLDRAAHVRAQSSAA